MSDGLPGDQEVVKPAVNDAPLFAGWSEEDRKWADTQHLEMHKTIDKYGRACFMLVMQAGITGVALGNVMAMQRLLGNKYQMQLIQGCTMIQRVMNDLMKQAMAYHNVTEAMFVDCKEEVERIGALMVATRPEGTSPGGLILPH